MLILYVRSYGKFRNYLCPVQKTYADAHYGVRRMEYRVMRGLLSQTAHIVSERLGMHRDCERRRVGIERQTRVEIVQTEIYYRVGFGQRVVQFRRRPEIGVRRAVAELIDRIRGHVVAAGQGIEAREIAAGVLHPCYR